MSDLKQEESNWIAEDVESSVEPEIQAVILSSDFKFNEDSNEDLTPAPTFAVLREKLQALSQRYPSIETHHPFETRAIPEEIIEFEERQISENFSRRIYKSKDGKIIAEQG